MILHLHWALDAYIYIMSFLLGGCMASFIVCMVSRKGQTLQKQLMERSHCDSCGHELCAKDLVPVFSWLFSKGECRYCGAKIPATCFFTEAGLGLYYALCVWRIPYIKTCLFCIVAGTVIFAMLMAHQTPKKKKKGLFPDDDNDNAKKSNSVVH